MRYIAKINYSNQDYYIKAVTLKTIDENGNVIPNGRIPSADGAGGLTWTSISSGVQSIGGSAGQIILGTGLVMNDNTLSCNGMDYTITAPSLDNPSGGYKVAILDQEPSSGTGYKAGWLYYILE